MTAPELDAATRRAYAANVRRFYLYKFLSNLQLWFPIWVLYLTRERGLSLTQVTALDAPFWLVMVLAEIPTGAVADRWGRKLSLLLGGILLALAIFLFGIGTSYPMLLISYLVWGVAMTLGSGADTAFLYDSLAGLGREEELSRVLGRARACDMAAGTIGALAGAPLAAATSLSLPIVVSAGIGLLGALVILTFREPHHRGTAPRLPYFRTMREAIRLPLHHPPLRAMIALNAVLTGAGMAGFIFLQPYLAAHDVPLGAFGALSVPQRLLAIAGALAAYRLAAWFGERNVFYALAAVLAGALFVLAAVPSVLAFGMFAALSFCNSAVLPLSGTYINRHAPDHLRATLASVAQMAASVVLALTEPLLGLIADRASLRTTFLVASIGVLLFGGAALAAWTLATRAEGAVEQGDEAVAAGR